MRRCCYCYEALDAHDTDMHVRCSRAFYGQPQPPLFLYTADEIDALAEQTVRTHTTIPGVQPKLSLKLEGLKGRHGPGRLTLVGVLGGYIVKPPSAQYGELPEIEDLTMHLAADAGIEVVPHALIRMGSGALAYISRRIDRTDYGKLHMEDLCQITGKLTEQKYRGSHEQIAKAIIAHSEAPMLDVVKFCERVLFSFVCGNADMHLKNYSLIQRVGRAFVLAPAYDLVATQLVHVSDDEDCALTLNGKKKGIRRKDVEAAFTTMGLSTRQQLNIFSRIERSTERWYTRIRSSFVSDATKEMFVQLIHERLDRLGMKSVQRPTQ